MKKYPYQEKEQTGNISTSTHSNKLVSPRNVIEVSESKGHNKGLEGGHSANTTCLY